VRHDQIVSGKHDRNVSVKKKTGQNCSVHMLWSLGNIRSFSSLSNPSRIQQLSQTCESIKKCQKYYF